MLLFLIPLASSALAFLVPILTGKNFKTLAAVLSLLPLCVLILFHASMLGSTVDYNWIPPLAIHFHLVVDHLTLVFLYLTAVIIPVSILAINTDKLTHPKMFYGLVLLLEGLLIGFFSTRDLALFTLFYEAMLIPLYFIITLWGGQQRQAAAFKFLIYMIAGSALLIAAVLTLYLTAGGQGTGTFNLDALAKVAPQTPYAPWICAIFLLAFAVKTPLFPFHAWLPDAYCQAPTSGTILLSAILSKAGIYGFVRVGMELFPAFMKAWSPTLLGLAIAGVFYGALAAWMQKDFKRLIAYSSFSHVNFVLAGLFAMTQTAEAGGILQALNHGITIAALFLVVGWLEEIIQTTHLGTYGGLTKYLPKLCWVTLFFVLSSVALPGLNNFVGELMIFFGLFGRNHWLAAFLALTVILSVVYMLRFMQKVYFGPASPVHEGWKDISTGKVAIALPLIVIIVWIGVYPTPVLNQIKPAVEKILPAATTENRS